jgi:hypothetical protein
MGNNRIGMELDMSVVRLLVQEGKGILREHHSNLNLLINQVEAERQIINEANKLSQGRFAVYCGLAPNCIVTTWDVRDRGDLKRPDPAHLKRLLAVADGRFGVYALHRPARIEQLRKLASMFKKHQVSVMIEPMVPPLGSTFCMGGGRYLVNRLPCADAEFSDFDALMSRIGKL